MVSEDVDPPANSHEGPGANSICAKGEATSKVASTVAEAPSSRSTSVLGGRVSRRVASSCPLPTGSRSSTAVGRVMADTAPVEGSMRLSSARPSWRT